MSNAWRLLDAEHSGPIEKPVLQTYFQILEGISNKITSDWKKDQKEKLVQAQSDLISDFLNSNIDEKNQKELLKKFRETHKELLRLENQYMSLKIEQTGKILDVNQETINDAIELNKIRNRVLSHFSSSEKIDSVWLEPIEPAQPNKTEMICRTYLQAYADYIS